MLSSGQYTRARSRERVTACGAPIESARERHGHFLLIAMDSLSGFHDSSCQVFRTALAGQHGAVIDPPPT
jgi:hypothetical protein